MSLATFVTNVMTPAPLTLERTSTVFDAARVMKGADIGSLPVIDGKGRLCGMVTDRDLVVRAIAEGLPANLTEVGDICSEGFYALRPDDTEQHAIELMSEHALRRLPVVDDDYRVIGVVSLGDLALDRDPRSALADISSAPPND